MNPEVITETMERYFRWWNGEYTETIYGFAFYSTSMLEYAGCTVFTEEGLDRVTEEYLNRASDKRDESRNKQRNSLRWSPCDSPHHMENEEIFEGLNAELNVLSNELYDLDDEKFEEAIDREYESILKGIRDFRSRFPTLLNEEVLVTMMWGDISTDEQFRFVRSCNTESTTKKYLEENNT